MEAIRKITRIDSTCIDIQELSDYIGCMAEIIVLPQFDKEKKIDTKMLMTLSGSLKSDIDPLKYQRQVRDEWKNRP